MSKFQFFVIYIEGLYVACMFDNQAIYGVLCKEIMEDDIVYFESL